MTTEFTSYKYYLLTRLRTAIIFYFERFLPSQKYEWKDLSGKNALVTGANVGVGLEIARGLALRGTTVTLACRSMEKAEAARKDILQQGQGKIKEDQVNIAHLDLSDLDSVHALAQTFGQQTLDILFNNAALIAGTYTKSPQGHELIYTTNILSHYLLTHLLLPRMNPGGRIINVSSHGHQGAKYFDVLNLDWSKTIESRGIKEGQPIIPGPLSMFMYTRTKLLQIIFTRELQDRLQQNETFREKNITVHSYHPGLVRSTIWERKGNMIIPDFIKRMLLISVNIFGISTTEGAATGLYLATSNVPTKTPGLYWYRMMISGPHRLVEDAQKRRLIFDQMGIEAKLDETLKV